MHYSQLVYQMMVRDEGVKKFPYLDSLRVLTIGIGHNLTEGLSDELINIIFEYDWKRHRKELLETFPTVSLIDLTRQAALINMAFQMGIPKLKKFKKMWAAIELRDWSEAYKQALDSQWAKQTPVRAQRVALQLLKGEWNG